MDIERKGVRVATLIDGVRDLVRSFLKGLEGSNAVASIGFGEYGGFGEFSVVIRANPFRAGGVCEAVIHLVRSSSRCAIRNEMGVPLRVVQTCQDVQGMARVG